MMVAKAAVDRRRHRGARSVHLPLRHQSGWQGSSFQGRERPVHLPLHHQLLQQALERRPQVRVRRLSAREPRLLLQI